MLGHATLAVRFAVPADPDSLATLRTVFRPLAIRYGLDDLDTAALRDGRPRGLTQAISRWLYALTDHRQAAVDGIEFDSRHGDQLRMWALYERAAAAVGEAYVDKNIRTWEAMQKVLDSGEHRPTHLRGRKPG